MARLARLVVPGVPHHVTQRVNRRQRSFSPNRIDEPERAAIESQIRTGRPRGGDAFVEALERRTGRSLKRRKPGRKPQAGD